jgi:signal peptidase II
MIGKLFSKGSVACLIVLLILVIDQIIKIEVKTGMFLHESIRVTDWFFIYFIENEGMAYGMTFINKLVLTLFRVLAVIVIGIYLYRQIRKGARWGYVVCLSMLLAGAGGNIIDCLCYGQVFSASTNDAIAQFVPWGDGYAPVFYGKVVDMFYFPIIDTYLPDWLPIWGGDHFIFFSPIFNFADSSISVSVVALLLFFRRELGGISASKEEKKEGEESVGNEDGEKSEETQLQE